MNHATTGNPRKKILVLAIVVAIVAILFVFFQQHGHHADSANTAGSSTSGATAAHGFNPHEFSTTTASSQWVIVNKQHQLVPKSYAPPLVVPNVSLKGSATASNMHVSSAMAPAMAALFAGAKTAGYNLTLSSGYRSYDYQVTVYGRIVSAKGQAAADKESARPGYSEHQTGLAADIAPRSGKCDLSECFGTTPEGIWVAANAYRYGFIIRYPADKVAITGYEYEPWHVRYVGTTLATQMHKQGIETLEEFFHVSGGTNYN